MKYFISQSSQSLTPHTKHFIKKHGSESGGAHANFNQVRKGIAPFAGLFYCQIEVDKEAHQDESFSTPRCHAASPKSLLRPRPPPLPPPRTRPVALPPPRPHPLTLHLRCPTRRQPPECSIITGPKDRSWKTAPSPRLNAVKTGLTGRIVLSPPTTPPPTKTTSTASTPPYAPATDDEKQLGPIDRRHRMASPPHRTAQEAGIYALGHRELADMFQDERIPSPAKP